MSKATSPHPQQMNYDQPPPYTPYINGPQPPIATVAGVHIAVPPPSTYNNPNAPVVNAYFPAYGTTTTTVVAPLPPEIIVIGACPVCRIGILEDNYSCLALCCAIFFFPLGVLCCLAMKNKVCSNCGAIFG